MCTINLPKQGAYTQNFSFIMKLDKLHRTNIQILGFFFFFSLKCQVVLMSLTEYSFLNTVLSSLDNGETKSPQQRVSCITYSSSNSGVLIALPLTLYSSQAQGQAPLILLKEI